MSTPNTIKVKPWGDGQGDFVVINKADFDAAVHQLHDDAPAAETAPPPANPEGESQAESNAAADLHGPAVADDTDAPPAEQAAEPTAAAAAPAAKTTRKARAAAAPAADTTEG